MNYPSRYQKVTLKEGERKAFIILSYWDIINFLKELRASKTPSESVAILSEQEPEREEASGYRTFTNWMSRIGLQHYRIRVSGHYYPYEIEKIKGIINPKKIIPVHTENPKLTKDF